MRRAAIRRMIVQRVASRAVNRVVSSKAANNRAASKVARNKAAALRKAKNPDDVKSGAVHTPRLMRGCFEKNVIRGPCCVWRRYFSADYADDTDYKLEARLIRTK